MIYAQNFVEPARNLDLCCIYSLGGKPCLMNLFQKSILRPTVGINYEIQIHIYQIIQLFDIYMNDTFQIYYWCALDPFGVFQSCSCRWIHWQQKQLFRIFKYFWDSKINVEFNSIVFDRRYACEKSLVLRQQSYRALFANKFELQNGFQWQWCKLMLTDVLIHCSDKEVVLLIWTWLTCLHENLKER